MDREITIAVSDEEARVIDERLNSGAYETPGDVIRAALDNLALVDNHPDLDGGWMRREIERSLRDGQASVSIDAAFAEVRQAIAMRAAALNDKGRG